MTDLHFLAIALNEQVTVLLQNVVVAAVDEIVVDSWQVEVIVKEGS